MSPKYFNITISIHELIIRYASNNFRFIILNPIQRPSKSAPRFLPKKQGWECAPTPMHRLPQCHLGNPWVECQNIYQVNQYDTPLSPQVFIPQDIHHVFSNLNIQSDMTKLQRVKIQFITTRVERLETSYDMHQPTLMSHRYSNVTTSIHDLIIRYASNCWRS